MMHFDGYDLNTCGRVVSLGLDGINFDHYKTALDTVPAIVDEVRIIR